MDMAARDIHLKPVDATVALRDKAYQALRSAIVSMDIYAQGADVRLDERRLAEELGVSRTPIREALTRLEQEGLVYMEPRRGTFVVRKSKDEILQIISVWGALEGLAARLGCEHAADEELAGLRKIFVSPGDPQGAMAAIDEYSAENIRFHQSIIRLSRCALLSEIADGLFIHMHAIRSRSIREDGRVLGSVVNHLQIIEAMEQRDAALAEQLVREHTNHLAEHVKQHVNWEY
jgi:DNA-binding GntR family transcriptional regulator